MLGVGAGNGEQRTLSDAEVLGCGHCVISDTDSKGSPGRAGPQWAGCRRPGLGALLLPQPCGVGASVTHL